MKKLLLLSVLILNSISQAADPHARPSRHIEFPDVPGYLTLAADLHQHTVFSDGSVWPDIRIQEAIRDGLDVVSMTEHLEYQPHKDDLPHPDRNRSFAVAQKAAENTDLIVVHGSEITRVMPPGHANAIFLTDSNKLMVDDPIDAYREAKKQGAFIFWNHPNWTSQNKDGVARLTDMHETMLSEGLLDGIEVVNDTTYSDEALQIALDRNLTIIGTSDIHRLIDWQYDVPNGGHRPVTLVFAKERTEASFHEALDQRRTVVWYNNTLIGRPEQLVPLIESCLKVGKITYPGQSVVASVEVENVSDAEFILRSKSEFKFHDVPDVLVLSPHETTRLQVKTLERLGSFDLEFEVLNGITAPGTHPSFTIKASAD